MTMDVCQHQETLRCRNLAPLNTSTIAFEPLSQTREGAWAHGDRVQVRDHHSEAWREGTVTSTKPLRVKLLGGTAALSWEMIQERDYDAGCTRRKEEQGEAARARRLHHSSCRQARRCQMARRRLQREEEAKSKEHEKQLADRPKHLRAPHRDRSEATAVPPHTLSRARIRQEEFLHRTGRVLAQDTEVGTTGPQHPEAETMDSKTNTCSRDGVGEPECSLVAKGDAALETRMCTEHGPGDTDGCEELQQVLQDHLMLSGAQGDQVGTTMVLRKTKCCAENEAAHQLATPRQHAREKDAARVQRLRDRLTECHALEDCSLTLERLREILAGIDLNFEALHLLPVDEIRWLASKMQLPGHTAADIISRLRSLVWSSKAVHRSPSGKQLQYLEKLHKGGRPVQKRDTDDSPPAGETPEKVGRCKPSSHLSDSRTELISADCVDYQAQLQPRSLTKARDRLLCW